MNLVDSCGWLEYFADGPNAKHFSAALKDAVSLIVPTITVYEVFRVVLRESGENKALEVCAAMQKGKTVDLSGGIAVDRKSVV